MSKIMRISVLVVGLMSLFAAMAGAASASTWHNSGGTAFTATGGPGTLTVGANSLSCSGGTATGTAGTSSAGPVWTNAASGRVSFTGCRIGGTPWHAYCNGFGLNAASWNSGTDVVTGTISLTGGCLAGPGTVNGTNDLCRIDGTPNGTYGNTTSTLTVLATSSLTVSNNGTCPSSLGTGSASLTSFAFRVTAGTAPNIRQP